MLWLGQSVHRTVSGYGSGYVCVCECRYFSFCLPHSVSVSMRVEFVCAYLSVISCVCLSCFCVFDVFAFKYASVCACLYAANDCVYLCLLAVYVYSSKHTFVLILLTSTEGCAKVSLYCVLPFDVTCSCSSQAGDWLFPFLLYSVEWPKKGPWSFRWT